MFELQGELFVGTAERVFRQVLDALDGLEIVVLDCKRVTRVDEAAQRMLDEIRDALESAGCALVLADAQGQPDVDLALEWCEDRVLERFGASTVAARSDLAAQELLRGLADDELAALTRVTRSHQLSAGDVLFKQGDPADSVFFIRSGALTVMLAARDDDTDAPSRRLARLGAGVSVGEMALVGDNVRSADVVAAQDSEVTELSVAAVAELAASHATLTTRLHANLAQVLSDRLRRANEQLRLLGR